MKSCPLWHRRRSARGVKVTEGTRTFLIQRVPPLRRSSDNALPLREFASFVVGKKTEMSEVVGPNVDRNDDTEGLLILGQESSDAGVKKLATGRR